MSEHHKKSWTTFWGILGGALLIVGGIVDFPQFLQRVESWGLDWLTHWRLWWCLIVISVTAFAIWRIWQTPAQQEPDERQKLRELAKDISVRCRQLVAFLDEEQSFFTSVVDLLVEHKGQIPPAFVYDKLEVAWPNKISTLFGEEVNSEFLKLVQDSKGKTSQPWVVCEAAHWFLHNHILHALVEEAKKKDRQMKRKLEKLAPRR